MMQDLFPCVGLDVSKASLDAQVGAKKGAKQHVENTASGHEQLHHWLQAQGVEQAHVCLEATGTYSDAVAVFLVEHGHRVSVVNPARVAAFRKSEGILTKNDRHDAWVLARFCEQKRPAAWTPPSATAQQLHVLLARAEDLIADRQRESNRLENSRLDEQTRQEIEQHREYLSSALTRTQQRVHAIIEQELSLREQAELLHSVPGIGKITAPRLLSLFEQLRFTSASQLVAYAGVCPSEKQSGTSVHGKPTMSKQGNAQLRKWLYLPALTAIRYDRDFRCWVEQLKARGLRGKQIVVAVMRKLLHVIYGVLKTKQPYDPRQAFPGHYAVVSPSQELSAA